MRVLTSTAEGGSGRWSLLTRGTNTSIQALLPWQSRQERRGQEPGLLDLRSYPRSQQEAACKSGAPNAVSYLWGSSQSLNCCTVRESGGLAKVGRKTSPTSKLKSTEQHHPRPRREPIPATSVALGCNWVFPSPPPTWLPTISLSPNPLLKEYFKYKPEGMPQTSSCQALSSVKHTDKNERLAFWKTWLDPRASTP